MAILAWRLAYFQFLLLVVIAASAPGRPVPTSMGSALERPITLDIRDATLRQALDEIERKSGVKFGYSDKLVDSVLGANLRVQNESVPEFLHGFLRGLNIDYLVDPDGHITLFQKLRKPEEFGFLGGQVVEGSSHEPISEATIVATRNGVNRFSTVSASDGSFGMRIPEGSYTVTVNGMEFVSGLKMVTGKRARFNIRLKGASLPAVEVYPQTGAVPSRSEFESGFHTLSLAREAAAPMVGSPDLFQSLQNLQGVGVFDDYTSKLFIRGSPPGQILFLLDGVAIEAPYHLFGMAGVFNPDAVEQVNLSSGVFSARYGDRVGGVVDIRTKTLGAKGVKGFIGINPAMTSLTILGKPNTKMDFLISGRRSHQDFASRVFRGEGTPYYFGDIYSKIGYRLTSADRLSFSGSYARDDFRKQIFVLNRSPEEGPLQENPASTVFSWSSWTFGARWSHAFSQVDQFELSYSKSGYSVKDGEENYERPPWAEDNFTDSRIFRQTLAGDLTWQLGPTHQFRVGSELVHHKLRYEWRRLNFQMTSASPFEDSTPTRLSIFFESSGDSLDYKKSVLQWFSYIENTWQPLEDLVVEAGVRFEKRSFTKDWAVAPRLNLGYRIGGNVKATAGYGRFYQGLTTAIDDTLLYMLPLLIPLERDLKLQSADQHVAGLQINLWDVTFSVEGYYKRINNQLTFFTTATDTAFQRLIGRSILSRMKSLNIASRLSQGKADDYGIEFGIQRVSRRLNLNLNYSFSYAKQDLPSLAKVQGAFSATDQRHAIKAFGRYTFGDHWNLGLRWSLTSGRPQLGVSEGPVDLEASRDCSRENPCRFPTYHRLDISVTRSFHYGNWKLRAYLQLPDIYRGKEVENFLYYNLDWGQGSQTSKQNLFPIMPVVPTFGIHIEF